ncbi:MAG: mycofactocin precursor MftA [Acidobacteria bacterium]|jgi:mycofactocin precursor|nr:mycofactocin precursor MftA [Acidobacteriota bacterium]
MTPAPNSAVLEASETRPVENDVATESVVLEELLVEEISIDGMCGVY